MQYRHLFPMVRILLPYMAGIILCLSLAVFEFIPFGFWLIALIALIVSGLIPATGKKAGKWLFGLFLNLFLFISGYNSVILHKEILRADHFSKTQNTGIYLATVAEPIQVKDHSFKTILKVKSLVKGKSIIAAEGRILTYFAKDSATKPPKEGSLLMISGNIQEIGPPQNPGSFDYQKYMAANNVYHQVYLNSFSWKIIKEPSGFSLFRLAHQASDRLVSILKSNGLQGREFGVASALILGQKDMLDNETLQAYSGSGVMHILSVSGLHVGIIFIIISFLLGFMKKKGGQLVFKTAVIIGTIWAYALLTGLSPSVLRAASMFTFISLGNASRRYVHIINSLAVSAIFLLLIDPLMISNIGFQLSYLAILGIVFINQPIAQLWNPSHRIAEYIRDLIAVSIAAQVATAPLAVFYFHQFPLYFLPANLVTIPVSFLAMYSGLSVLATSVIPAVSNFFGIITNSIFFVLNYCVEFIESLPYSVLHIQSVFTIEAILIYLIIISIALLIYYKRKQYLMLTLSFIFLLSASITLTAMNREQQQKIIFYSTGKQSAVGFINGRQQALIADSVLINNATTTKFQLDGAAQLFGISHANAYALDTMAYNSLGLPKEQVPLRNIGNYFMFNKKRVVFVNSIPKIKQESLKLTTNYLVIRKNPKLTINELQLLYHPEVIIFDGSNSVYKTDKWMAECKAAGIKSYSTKSSGAFIVDL